MRVWLWLGIAALILLVAPCAATAANPTPEPTVARVAPSATAATAVAAAKGMPEAPKEATTAPEWWVAKPEDVRRVLAAMPGVTVEEIGKSAGGRPIIAASYEPREDLGERTSTSLAAALAAGKPSAFFGSKRRSKQVILFVGAAHGTEFEGTVAAINYLNILATGKDLRGRDQTKMAETGRRHRFIVIPFFNIDGREHAKDIVTWVGVNDDYHTLMTFGRGKGGETYQYPAVKALSPLPLDKMEFVGSYFNDHGVILTYDDFLAGDAQPETTALMRYYRREVPDLVIFSHSDAGSLVNGPQQYMPKAYQVKVNIISTLVGLRCAREGFPTRAIYDQPSSEGGAFYHGAAACHVCGALPILIEFPYGYRGQPDKLETILDIGLAVIDEISDYGVHRAYKPPMMERRRPAPRRGEPTP